jgi:hypothetical protein
MTTPATSAFAPVAPLEYNLRRLHLLVSALRQFVTNADSLPPSNGRKSARPPELYRESLTLASPTTAPHSPIHYPTTIQRTFTRLSYFKEAFRAPRHM